MYLHVRYLSRSPPFTTITVCIGQNHQSVLSSWFMCSPTKSLDYQIWCMLLPDHETDECSHKNMCVHSGSQDCYVKGKSWWEVNISPSRTNFGFLTRYILIHSFLCLIFWAKVKEMKSWRATGRVCGMPYEDSIVFPSNFL